METPRLLKVTITLSKSVFGTILLSESDDPMVKSEEFLKSHNLDVSLKHSLAQFIRTEQMKKFKTLETTRRSETRSRGEQKKTPLINLSQRLLKHSYRYSSLSSVNYGKILYSKGKEFKEKQLKLVEEKKSLKENDDQKILTFKPEINKKSKKIVKELDKAEKTEKKQEKEREVLKNKQERDSKECFFTPCINDKRKEERNVFHDLYKNACLRMESPGKPLRKASSSLVFSKRDKLKEDIIETMVERLSSSHKASEEIIELKRREAEAPFDKETGQRLFTPLISHNYSSIREERTVWEDLYNTRSFKKSPETFNTFVKTSENTTRFFEKLKITRFSEIFSRLDSDGDGKISSQLINLQGFDSKILILLCPVLKELEKSEKEMRLDEFVIHLNQVYNLLGTSDRMALTQKLKKEESRSNFPFNPVINERSKKIANHSYLGSTIYERSVTSREISNLKNLKKAELQEISNKFK